MSIPKASREALLKEWTAIAPNKEKKIVIAQLFYRRLFEAHPDYIKLFKRFDNMNSLDEIIDSTQTKSHGLRFVNSISSIFETLDEPGELGDMLQHVAESHKSKNVTCEHFAATVPILQEVLLGQLKSNEAKEALKVVLAAAVPIIMKQYEPAACPAKF